MGHHRRPADVARAAETQAALMEAAAAMVRPGGRLVYCVCSLQPEEGEERAAAFLDAHPEFARVPVDAAELGGDAGWVTVDGDLRTLPCHWVELGGLDGFFAARFDRRMEEG